MKEVELCRIMEKKTNMMIIYFSKIQSNESLTAGTSRCRRMGNIEKAAAGIHDGYSGDAG